MLHRGRYSPLGIDIGSHLIKVVQLKRNNNGVTLFQHAVKETPPGSIEEGKINNSEKIAAYVKKICSSNNFKGNKAVISISGENVIIKRLVFSGITREELKQAVRFEVEKHISLSPEDIIYDFESVKESHGQREVLLAAVSKIVVEGYMEVMHRANLYPQAVEAEVTALTRQFSFYLSALEGDIEKEKHYLLLDVGARTIHVILLCGTIMCFSRCLPWGGVDCAELVTGVQKTVDYYAYKTRRENPEVENLFITGGKSGLKGLREYITKQLEVETTFLHTFNVLSGHQKLFSGTKKGNNIFSVGIGLALRGWEDVCN